MYRSVRFDGYRGLVALELDDLARVNVIAGRNDTGKTTILEAILLLACGPFAASNALQVLRPLRNRPPVEFPWSDRDSPWSSFFHELDSSRPIVLSGVRAGRRSTITITGDPAAPQAGASVAADLSTQTASASVKVTVEHEGSPPVERTQRVEVHAVGGLASAVQQMSVSMPLEPPASLDELVKSYFVKTGVSFSIEAAYSELRRTRRDRTLVEALQGLDPRIRGLEVLVGPSRSELHAELDGGVVLPLSLLGDGPLMLTYHLLAMEEARGGVLLLDEVEKGMHWSVMEHLWKVLHRAATRLDVQVFATTHSDECLTAAASAFSEQPDDLRLYRLTRGQAGLTGVAVYEQPDIVAGLSLNVDLR
ncbi:AAA domain-containing protein, putative AbiEii toxin, Type IV TA system [Quadrisphaera granulorum]|uniref:Putative AbiEii toxin of type IV toxin-antitoxin system n=1 Tax=Quadrisphaera granulorum TaxID=317664 RepID=A0A316A6Z9_9ACTN|nr:ATP-binding protein [Quadrisphaera granulorum]PWJ52998.1 putative AbiEii toxin of type IV toxin-antitoxin system [Quadrisphaera granulorum]SZE97163.1 AAA domain-containing protein, putative AbiEii toxin, Type IV TA system [Quadrisphaera granulorum]